MPAVSVGRITSVSVERPSERTSAIDALTVLRLMPTPAVRFACGSMSMSRTRRPSSASAPARLIAVVVLPTPPFWLAMAITCVKGVTSGSGVRSGTGGRSSGGMLPRGSERAPVEVVHTMTELCTVLWISAARESGRRHATIT